MNLTINYYNKEGMYEFKSTVLFSKVAQLQHYHQAAKELNISQPSLSRSIANLEEELGVSLFQKNGRNIELTKYGSIFWNMSIVL